MKERKEGVSDYIVKLFGSSHVVISARNGVLYEGVLVGKEHGYLVLRDCIVRGSKYTARVSYCLVNVDMIQHIHDKPLELKEQK